MTTEAPSREAQAVWIQWGIRELLHRDLVSIFELPVERNLQAKVHTDCFTANRRPAGGSYDV